MIEVALQRHYKYKVMSIALSFFFCFYYNYTAVFPGKSFRHLKAGRSLGCRTTQLEHWSKRKPTVEPGWAKQQTKKLRPQPTKINSFISGAMTESDGRPTGVQLKREAKLLTVIGLNTKHADCRIIFMLYPVSL